MSDEKEDDIPSLDPRDALKLILEICEPISTGDLDDPVERVCRIAEKSLQVPCESISPEKMALANKLYAQATYFRRVVLEMMDELTPLSLKSVNEEGERLDKILSDINGGRLPYWHETPSQRIRATIALVSGGI